MQRPTLRHSENLNTSKPSPARKALQYVKLILKSSFSKRNLERVPEPFTLTEQDQHVEDYSRAINSVMVLPYVLVLDLVYRVTGKKGAAKALDLCCGPGHFTRMLVKNLDCQQVTGVDLSEPMLQKAAANAKTENLSAKLTYVKSDVAALKVIETSSIDIVSFMNGAHHMSSLEKITEILSEADRVAKPDGIVIVMDPVRPKTLDVAETYHRIAGQQYVEMGLDHFNQDFQDSIFASWSAEEFLGAVPGNSERKWVQLVPFGFPAFQIVIGIPKTQEKLFLSKGLPSEEIESLIPEEAKADWTMLKLSFKLARRHQK